MKKVIPMVISMFIEINNPYGREFIKSLGGNTMMFTVSAFLMGLSFILCKFDNDWGWLNLVCIAATIASIFTL